jgi:hypothetical protein
MAFKGELIHLRNRTRLCLGTVDRSLSFAALCYSGLQPADLWFTAGVKPR